MRSAKSSREAAAAAAAGATDTRGQTVGERFELFRHLWPVSWVLPTRQAHGEEAGAGQGTGVGQLGTTDGAASFRGHSSATGARAGEMRKEIARGCAAAHEQEPALALAHNVQHKIMALR